MPDVMPDATPDATPNLPSLLPWQFAVLAWLCGIWSVRFPVPALVAGTLLFGACLRPRYGTSALRQHLFHRLHRVSRLLPAPPPAPASPRTVLPTAAAMLLALCTGIGAAHLALNAPLPTPGFMDAREKVRITGTVYAVQPAMAERLQVILDDVRCQRDNGETVSLPGRTVWTWDSPMPATMPRIGPGQQVSLTQRIKPVRGFLNPGTWDSGQYWRDQGVLWRVWSRGSGYDLAISCTPSALWQLRETLRTRTLNVLAQGAGPHKPISGAAAAPESDMASGLVSGLVTGQVSGKASDLASGATPGPISDVKSGVTSDMTSGPTPGPTHNPAPEPDMAPDLAPHLTADKQLTDTPLSVVPALLFGDRFHITYDRMEQLSLASVSHSLALSGMHLGVLSGLGWCLAWLAGRLCPAILLRLPRPKLAVLFAAPLVAGYVWLGGATPSLLRAALMFACWGLLLWRNRPRVLLDGVFMAVALITLHNPLALFDLRLQLSALAVLSLALLLNPVNAALRRLPPFRTIHTDKRVQAPHGLPAGSLSGAQRGLFHTSASISGRVSGLGHLLRNGTAGLLAANLCIQLGMLPVVVWNFNTVSPWFLLNLLWLPVLGMITLPASLAGFAFSQMAALPLADATQAMAAWSFRLAAQPVTLLFDGLDALQQAGWLRPHLSLRPHWLSITGYWCVLLFVATAFTRHSRTAAAGMLLGLCLLCAPLATRLSDATGPLNGGTGGVSLTLLDVGQGQAALITLPHEQRILVDGGGFGLSGFDTGKSLVVPTLTWRMPPALHGIANSHPDTDHLQGLIYPLRHARVQRYAGNGQPGSHANEGLLSSALASAGLSHEALYAGDVLWEDNGLRLEVLHPPRRSGQARNAAGQEKPLSANNAALVLRLVHHGRGLALLMGDLERQGLRTLLGSGADLSAEVLVLPHHGARSSLMPELYAAVRPHYAISSTGQLNQWNFPSPAVRAALADMGIPLYDTARHGQIRVHWPSGSLPLREQTANLPPGTPAGQPEAKTQAKADTMPAHLAGKDSAQQGNTPPPRLTTVTGAPPLP
ncbi:ComEC/Rec2 family competence protein [Desulfovibrio psychrotolerans]|uniref:Competence protein ComEC n=1 Tax=Desulfovibrio psychrotolerans TaxID=415242 RepID=A0A7J0BY34_9BACT|nr:ComEC/Rec2 family competence protein [Desulfovibrio psychrotolerans]GFM38593.1 hypothetical protein DSM19430T_32770 [Desulfovibrio psychrotolerans]